MTEPVLNVRDVRAWRWWLEDHHGTETGAVLLISKKAAPQGVHYEEALEEALCFGWIDGKLRAHDAERFALRFSPRRADSIWSKSNRERATRLLREGRMNAAGRASIEQAKVSGAWQAAYRVARVPPIPRELRAAFQANPAAWSHFQAWAPTYRGACIRYVKDAKREATRKERVRRVVKRAAEDKRPGIEGF